MKIRMVEERTGGRWDGRAWPPVGGELYVDGEEGAAICAHGWAVPVPEDDVEVPEAAQKVLEETRAEPEPPAAEATPEPPPAEPPARGQPAVNAPKADWVTYAVSLGVPQADAEALTKQQLVGQYGG